MVQCIAFGCVHNKNIPGVTSHLFPKNIELSEKWSMQSEERFDHHENIISTLCSHHFETMDSVLNDDSDEELENKEWEQKYSGKSGFVFAIDARKPMFQGGSESYFLRSFQFCLEAMLQIAREQRYDIVSIVLFGAAKSEGKFAPFGTVLIQPLYTPSVLVVKKLKSMVEGNFEEIINNYGHGKEVSIHKILNYCKNLLHYCKTKLYTKTIVLFTYDDNPHANDVQSAHQARKRAEEIREHAIELEVVGLGSFDSSIFYKELILTSRGELMKDWVGRDPVKNLDDIQNEIAGITKKTTRHYGMFYFGESVQMKLIFYKLYHEPQKLLWVSKEPDVMPEKELVDLPEEGKSNDKEDDVNIFEQETQVDKKVVYCMSDKSDLMADTIPYILIHATITNAACFMVKLACHWWGLSKCEPGRISNEAKKERPEKYPLIGGEYIPMSKKELRWYEVKVQRGLTLVGFKHLDSIPVQLSCGEPYFVIPDRSEKCGEELFSHLLQACLTKSVAPVCWYSFTSTSNPTLVILYPTEPAEYAKGKVHPHGFHLIKLPFVDMISDYLADDLPVAESSEIQREAADGIVKKTTINWSPDTFADFEYRSRLAMIEAIAMEYDDVEEVVDQTDIDLEAIADRLGNLNSMFMDCSHLPAEALGKRGPSDSGSSKAKEPKIEDIGYLISMVKSGEANKLTVAQLRELLRGEGIKSLSTLTKPRLVAIANDRFCPEKQ